MRELSFPFPREPACHKNSSLSSVKKKTSFHNSYIKFLESNERCSSAANTIPHEPPPDCEECAAPSSGLQGMTVLQYNTTAREERHLTHEDMRKGEREKAFTVTTFC